MRRVLPILLALAMFAPGFARASTWLECTQDGTLRARCCCKHAPDPDPTPVARRACCCRTVSLATASAPEREHHASLAIAPPPPVIAIASVVHTPARPVPATPTRAGAGPPLPVLHCALLL